MNLFHVQSQVQEGDVANKEATIEMLTDNDASIEMLSSCDEADENGGADMTPEDCHEENKNDCTEELTPYNILITKNAKTKRLNRRYECKKCHKFFVKLTLMKIHLEVHSQKRPYRCLMCGRGFT